jgi:lactate dehydrogenase-like 2-hydroxyacid dehydrogenase
MTRIFLTRRWPAEVEDHLRSMARVELNKDDRALSAAEIAAAMEHADILCPTVSDAISADVINHPASAVKMICNYGAGYDHIDLDACRARGIIVTNTPDVLSEATAELALALMLMVARRAGEGERELRSGRWSGWRPTHMLGTSLAGKRLGLIGFGRIAQVLARKAGAGLGMKILYHSRRRAPPDVEAAASAHHCASLDELIASADVVSLHCPGGQATEGLIGAEQLRRMKPTALLINTARGSVVDETALAAALRDGAIAGAGLDVFRNEPRVSRDLIEAPNIVLLPHLGSATSETRIAMGMRAAENLEAWIAGREPPNRIA